MRFGTLEFDQKQRSSIALFAAALLLAALGSAQAQTMERLPKVGYLDFGAAFVIDNRPGGGGNIGIEAVVRAPADGYTLLLVARSTPHSTTS